MVFENTLNKVQPRYHLIIALCFSIEQVFLHLGEADFKGTIL